MTLKSLLKKCVDIIKDLADNKFSGKLSIIITFHEGGVRKAEKAVKDSFLQDS